MHIISRKPLIEFSFKHADAKGPLNAWWAVATKADWAGPQDIKAQYPKVSIVADNRAVFNIGGGSYRLVVRFNYPSRTGFVRFVGTHAEYDKIDVTKV